jgi:hypothetical protein
MVTGVWGKENIPKLLLFKQHIASLGRRCEARSDRPLSLPYPVPAAQTLTTHTARGRLIKATFTAVAQIGFIL